MLLIYSYFTFLDSVNAISVQRANRLFSESTRILCTSRLREYEDRPDCLKHALLRGQETVSLSVNAILRALMNEVDYKTMKNKIALTLIAITLAASAFGQGYHSNNG
jgi:hypothetical protein